MGTTKRRKDSRRREEGGGKSGHERMRKDVREEGVFDVIERERRNLQRASAVLAALTASVGGDEQDFDAGDVAHVARQLIDGATDALDRVELERASKEKEAEPPA